MQTKEWDPVIQWFCDRFVVDVKKIRNLETPQILEDTRFAITKHFLSYDFASINGIEL
jgi:ATP synthase mitochondrial F1 complex assembly factor 2